MVERVDSRQMKIGFRSNGKPKATCPPDPKYPMGMDKDLRNKGEEVACKVSLPYPGPAPGMHTIECRRCGMSVMITCAGRIDDPRSVIIACKNTNSATSH